MEQIIDFPVTIKIKEECLDEEHTYLPPLTPSEALEEYYLNREFKTECEVEVYNNQQVNCLNEGDGEFNNNFTEIADNNYYNEEDGTTCLDERDGKFKRYEDVVAYPIKTDQEEDLKNYCSKCNVEYDSCYASQKHFLFAHSNLYQLGYLSVLPLPNNVAGTQPLKNCIRCHDVQLQTERKVAIQNNMEKFVPSLVIEPQVPKKISEPVAPKLPIIKYEPILKAKVPARERKPYYDTSIFKKHYGIKKVMGFPKTVNNLIPKKELEIPPKTNSLDKKYTLESIKANPLKDIKIVKKSEILFNELQTKAKESIIQKMIEHSNNKKENGIISLVTPKYIKRSVTQKYREASSKEVKFLCQLCYLEFPDVISFDSHMLIHSTSTYVCEFCSKTFCTKIALNAHRLENQKKGNSINKICTSS